MFYFLFKIKKKNYNLFYNCIVALLLTAILWTWDSMTNGILNMSIKQRIQLESNK
jgi:Na+/serine symporter